MSIEEHLVTQESALMIFDVDCTLIDQETKAADEQNADIAAGSFSEDEDVQVLKGRWSKEEHEKYFQGTIACSSTCRTHMFCQPSALTALLTGHLSRLVWRAVTTSNVLITTANLPEREKEMKMWSLVLLDIWKRAQEQRKLLPTLWKMTMQILSEDTEKSTSIYCLQQTIKAQFFLYKPFVIVDMPSSFHLLSLQETGCVCAGLAFVCFGCSKAITLLPKSGCSNSECSFETDQWWTQDWWDHCDYSGSSNGVQGWGSYWLCNKIRRSEEVTKLHLHSCVI